MPIRIPRTSLTTWLTSAAVTGALVAGTLAVTSQDSDAAAPSATTAVSPDVPVTVVAEPSTEGLEAISTSARFAVSVSDDETGAGTTYGDGAFDTASVVKVDILAALLHRHQEAGTSMTSAERALASAMIEHSDNDAATALYRSVGGESGLEGFNASIGLTGTDVGPDGLWGLTTTTTTDQVRLLRVVLGDATVLDDDSQAYARSLMSAVEADQRFGVSAAADDASAAVLKVGFLQRSTTGLWDVTSIGEVVAQGHTYLVAVLTDGNATYADGVALADEVARAAVEAMSAI